MRKVEEVRKKLEVKEEEAAQLLYVNMANERRIAELTTRVATNQVGSKKAKSLRSLKSSCVGCVWAACSTTVLP